MCLRASPEEHAADEVIQEVLIDHDDADTHGPASHGAAQGPRIEQLRIRGVIIGLLDGAIVLADVLLYDLVIRNPDARPIRFQRDLHDLFLAQGVIIRAY